MSESDTMFNERDRRCAVVQLMHSTDPCYDNRTIASSRKMQIRTVQRLRAQLNASDDPSDGYGYGLWCGFKWGPHRATSHLRSRLESQHQSVLWLCWRVWWSPGAIRWPVADSGCGSRTRRRPASPKIPRLSFRRSATTLYPSLTGHPPLPTWTLWTTSFGHTSRTSPTWPPTTLKPAWSPPSAEYSPSSRRRLWKTHILTSINISDGKSKETKQKINKIKRKETGFSVMIWRWTFKTTCTSLKELVKKTT